MLYYLILIENIFILKVHDMNYITSMASGLEFNFEGKLYFYFTFYVKPFNLKSGDELKAVEVNDETNFC